MSFFSKVVDGLRGGKDLSASVLARKFAQERFGKYGEIRNLSLDSKAKQLRLEVHLTGETEPISVLVHRYEVVKNGTDYCVVIRDASASKTWMNHALADFVIGKQFSIPPKYGNLVRALL